MVIMNDGGIVKGGKEDGENEEEDERITRR